MPTGAELFVSTLEQFGVADLFTLVGDHLNEVLAVAARRGIRIVDMRHESGVVHAADAYARLRRRPAVSLVTGGPGHTNSLTGIATAALAASPVIAVSGSTATTAADRQAFQDIDQIGTAKPLVKWAAQPPNAAQIPFYLGRAFAEANAGRKGPTHLSIPVDLFTASAGSTSLPVPTEAAAAGPAAEQVAEIAAALRAAERPVVIAGSGVWWSGAEQELAALVTRTSIPLYTITMARGVVSDEHPLCMGYADPALNRAAHKAFQEADLFLILGKRIDYRLGLGTARVLPPAAKCIQVDIHPQELGMNRKLDIAVAADVRATLRQLLTALGVEQWAATPWLGRVRELRAAWQQELMARVDDGADEFLHPAAVYRELLQALPAETLYSWDGGDFVHWGRAMTPATQSGGWLRLGPLGTIGAALPNGIAMKLQNPERPVAVITGDGSLGFYIAEMDTAVRHNLPLIVIVGNDAGWGLERELQNAGGTAATVGCELRPTRYDVIMQGFGGGGEDITRLEEIGPAIGRALAARVPYCLNINIRGTRSPFTDWQVDGKKGRG